MQNENLSLMKSALIKLTAKLTIKLVVSKAIFNLQSSNVNETKQRSL